MILFLVIFCVLVALGFALASAVSDYRSMTIPNVYAGGIVLAFVPAFAADMLTGQGMEFFASWQSHLIALAVIFGLSFLMFTLKVMGAGDSKLLSAVALWCGLAGLAPLMFYMAISGALLALCTKYLNKNKLAQNAAEGSWIARSQAGEQGVPYGIAIFIGTAIAFWQLGYFSPEKLGLLTGYTENLLAE